MYFRGFSLQLWIEIADSPLEMSLVLRLPVGADPGKQIVTTVDADLLIDVVQVGFDRRQRDEQLARDVRIAFALDDFENDFTLPVGDPVS